MGEGPNGAAGNEEADKLAAAGAAKQLPDDIDIVAPQNFDFTGLKYDVPSLSPYIHTPSQLTTSIREGVGQLKTCPCHPRGCKQTIGN